MWFGDPAEEYICEETADEVVRIRDASGQVIGVEILHYQPSGTALSVETITTPAA